MSCLVGLFAGLVVMPAYASEVNAASQSVTYYFDPDNYGGCGGNGLMGSAGTLDTSPVLNDFVVEIGGACETSELTTQYTGPTLNVTQVIYTFNGCQSPGTQFFVGIQGPVGGAQENLPICSEAGGFTDTVVPAIATQLVPGENLSSFLSFGLDSSLGGSVGFSASVTIFGVADNADPVSEFPLGISAVLVLAVPALLLFRLREHGGESIRSDSNLSVVKRYSARSQGPLAGS
jgi:hypothetical protein